MSIFATGDKVDVVLKSFRQVIAPNEKRFRDMLELVFKSGALGNF